MKTSPVLIAFMLAAALISGGCSTTPSPSSTQSTPSPTRENASEPSLDGTSLPPWPAPTDVADRVAGAGLDLGPMGTAEHYHPRLRIVIDGIDVPVAPNIGVDPTTGAMSALHTHEGDGTLHIEADTEGEVFTLGQLFIQWGVKLTPRQVGGVRTQPGERVAVTSDGDRITGDPMDLRLAPDQEIVLVIG